MLIDFKNLEETVIPHMRGGEKEFAVKAFSDGKCKIMHGRLIPGASIGLHTHETNSEIMHVLSGTARVVMDGQIEYVHAGQTHYCPKGHSHMTEPYGMQELVVLAVVPEQ